MTESDDIQFGLYEILPYRPDPRTGEPRFAVRWCDLRQVRWARSNNQWPIATTPVCFTVPQMADPERWAYYEKHARQALVGSPTRPKGNHAD